MASQGVKNEIKDGVGGGDAVAKNDLDRRSGPADDNRVCRLMNGRLKTKGDGW